MKIIKIQAGLGNQMFQYALGMSLQPEEVRFDCAEIETQGNNHNGLELEKIFPLEIARASKEEVELLTRKDRMFWRRALNKICKGKYRLWLCENFSVFHPGVYVKGDRYLEGYWQSEKYFSGIKDEIRRLYQFPLLTDSRNIECSRRIKETNSVAVHIRRGDYVSVKENDFLRGICTTEYYDKAIKILLLKTKNPVFYFFSDDIRWVQENIKVENGIYITWNNGKDSYIDMQLMSMCRHNIIANSTFSWWAAWLNTNPNKIIIAPEKWDQRGSKDIQCEDWILI